MVLNLQIMCSFIVNCNDCKEKIASCRALKCESLNSLEERRKHWYLGGLEAKESENLRGSFKELLCSNFVSFFLCITFMAKNIKNKLSLFLYRKVLTLKGNQHLKMQSEELPRESTLWIDWILLGTV